MYYEVRNTEKVKLSKHTAYSRVQGKFQKWVVLLNTPVMIAEFTPAPL